MNAINRPDPEVIAALSEIGCDTICSTLDGLGIKRNNIVGPVARVPGTKICGPALTLQFLPLREDQLGNFALPGKTAEETKKEVEGEEAFLGGHFLEGSGPLYSTRAQVTWCS